METACSNEDRTGLREQRGVRRLTSAFGLASRTVPHPADAVGAAILTPRPRELGRPQSVGDPGIDADAALTVEASGSPSSRQPPAEAITRAASNEGRCGRACLPADGPAVTSVRTIQSRTSNPHRSSRPSSTRRGTACPPSPIRERERRSTTAPLRRALLGLGHDDGQGHERSHHHGRTRHHEKHERCEHGHGADHGPGGHVRGRFVGHA